MRLNVHVVKFNSIEFLLFIISVTQSNLIKLFETIPANYSFTNFLVNIEFVNGIRMV